MSTMTPRKWFDVVLKQFVYEDVGALLNWDEDKAGPILVATSCAIDNLVGFLRGFSVAHGLRFRYVLETYMCMTPDQAELTWSVVRRPTLHAGVPSAGIAFMKNSPKEAGNEVFIVIDNKLTLVADTLARCLRTAIDQVEYQLLRGDFVGYMPPSDNLSELVERVKVSAKPVSLSTEEEIGISSSPYD